MLFIMYKQLLYLYIYLIKPIIYEITITFLSSFKLLQYP